MASFLQYCAMCEKQIRTPSNSILYCSQACRRKDAAKPLSAAILPSTNAVHHSKSSPTSPKRLDTATAHTSHTGSPTPSISIPPTHHVHTTDLDPTEWKPKLRNVNGSSGSSNGTQRNTPGTSEAYRYLSRFHERLTNDNDDNNNDSIFLGRPSLLGHKYSSSMSTVPSLTHQSSLASTPMTAASSFDTSWEYEYDFRARPLQLRRDPVYAVGLGGDLVTPFVAPKVEVVVPGEESEGLVGEDFWGKKVVVKGKGVEIGTGSGLGRLIGESVI